MVRGDVGHTTESASGSRCTRSHSHAGPVWSVQDMLILVNEIAAVEVDCQDALSSYQKWNIIAENCTALEVVASNATQCRRKWESLLADFNLVKEWESKSLGDSYWMLGSERRQEIGLPVEFDKDLYNAIDGFTKAREQTDIVPERDSEAEDAEVDVDVFDADEFGPKSKKAKHRSTPHRKRTKRRKPLGSKEEHEKPVAFVKEMDKILDTDPRVNMESGSKQKRLKSHSSPLKSILHERKPPVLDKEPEKPEPEPEKPEPVIDKLKQALGSKVKQNTELIQAILVDGSDMVEEGLSNLRDEAIKTERVRSKAEKLIACLADLAKNMEQLCDVVKER